MLKKVSSIQASIRPIEIDGEKVVFVSDTDHAPGDELRLSASDSVLAVLGRRTSESGENIYWGRLSQGDTEVLGVEVEAGERVCPRTSVCLKVRSPELPNFSAVTENLSPWGARLRTDDPLVPGDTLTLTLEIEDVTISEVEGVVRWSSLTEPFTAGIAFAPGPWQSELGRLLKQRSKEAQLVDLSPVEAEVWRFPAEATLIKVDCPNSSLNLTVHSGGHHYVFSFEEPEVLHEDMSAGVLAAVSRLTLPGGATRVRFFDLLDQPLLDVVCYNYRAFCSLARAG